MMTSTIGERLMDSNQLRKDRSWTSRHHKDVIRIEQSILSSVTFSSELTNYKLP